MDSITISIKNLNFTYYNVIFLFKYIGLLNIYKPNNISHQKTDKILYFYLKFMAHLLLLKNFT
jgi:hypothetical protein